MFEDNSEANLDWCEKIGEWACHVVYATASWQVIKVPKFIWWILNSYASHYEENLIMHKYFGEYVWPTNVIPSTTRSYRIEQPRLPTYSVLNEKLLRDDHICGQFEDILRKNEELYRDRRMSFDFFWLEGIISASLMDSEVDIKKSNGFKKAIASFMSDVLIGKGDIVDYSVISNIVVIEEHGEKKLRIVDCTLMDEMSDSLLMRAINRACNYFTRRFMKKCFWRDILT